MADLRLADCLFAPHYASAVIRTAIARTPLFDIHGGNAVSELLNGEQFEILEFSQGHAWGLGAVDGAVGFVSCDALGPPIEPTYVVCATSLLYPMGSRLTNAQAAATAATAIRPLGAPIADYVALAETLIGTPALTGGRSSAGVDAAGLVFLTLSLAGIRAPRFVDLQASALGHAIEENAPMLRGDLLFLGDHVAIVADANTAVHVGAAAVRRDPIATLLSAAALGAPIVRRRLP